MNVVEEVRVMWKTVCFWYVCAFANSSAKKHILNLYTFCLFTTIGQEDKLLSLERIHPIPP